MSKLITGEIAINDLSIIDVAVAGLGWQITSQTETVRRIKVVDEAARYSPYIEVDDTGKMTYDNWMGAQSSDLHSAEHKAGQADDVTKRVIGQLKQTVALITMTRHLKAQRATWRYEKRADGAMVLTVKK